MTILGRHLLVEFWGCNAAADSTDVVRQAMIEATAAIQATLLHLHIERFQPQGVTGIAVLAESHFSVHSWPERGYLAADIFTCGEQSHPEKAIAILQRFFEPQSIDVAEVQRGVVPTKNNRPSEPFRLRRLDSIG